MIRSSIADTPAIVVPRRQGIARARSKATVSSGNKPVVDEISCANYRVASKTLRQDERISECMHIRMHVGNDCESSHSWLQLDRVRVALSQIQTVYLGSDYRGGVTRQVRMNDWANALSPEELDGYLRAWRDLYPEHLPLITTLVLTGLRWGEATALIWSYPLHGGV
jgi:hypothetical protein